ncbi:hypothetical protein ACOMHN_062315 [Nucella lapillus]
MSMSQIKDLHLDGVKAGGETEVTSTVIEGNDATSTVIEGNDATSTFIEGNDATSTVIEGPDATSTVMETSTYETGATSVAQP